MKRIPANAYLPVYNDSDPVVVRNDAETTHGRQRNLHTREGILTGTT